jgi:hypothetical protein
VLNYGLDGANLRITNIHTVSNDHLPYLVLAYQFTKNAKYAQRAWDQLNAMCSWPDWGANRHFLDAGIASKAVGMAFDGLYDWLSSAQRIQLYNALRNFAIGPGKNQIDNGSGPFKWYETDDNWNGICHGGMIMAALATYEMDTTFNSALIASCANGMLKYLQSFDPDGASEEGLSYWSYGLSNTFLALESAQPPSVTITFMWVRTSDSCPISGSRSSSTTPTWRRRTTRCASPSTRRGRAR